MKTNVIEIKQETEGGLVIAGYGVVFGGRDLEGDTFTSDTDFRLRGFPNPVHYQHGFDEAIGTREIGETVRKTLDDKGMWVEAQLALSEEYLEDIKELIEKGVLGWSSGSVPHIVERKGGLIKTWPVYEFSLTPTPAEPRTLGVSVQPAVEGGGEAKIWSLPVWPANIPNGGTVTDTSSQHDQAIALADASARSIRARLSLQH
jgi:phage head maturation protease